MTVSALEDGDSAAASEWLRLREYRQATKFSLVDDPAAQAIFRLQAGGFQASGGNLDDVITTVTNDLRDAYTFRLREALNQAVRRRRAEFHGARRRLGGAVSGYFGILQAISPPSAVDAETDGAPGAAISPPGGGAGGNLATVAGWTTRSRTRSPITSRSR